MSDAFTFWRKRGRSLQFHKEGWGEPSPTGWWFWFYAHLDLVHGSRLMFPPLQSGMKGGWHLTEKINHPWPQTNYPSLPTLPGSQETAVWQETQHERRQWQAAVQNPPLMDGASLREPRSADLPDLVTLWQEPHKGACVQGHDLRPLKRKSRGPWLDVRENKSDWGSLKFSLGKKLKFEVSLNHLLSIRYSIISVFILISILLASEDSL